MNINKNLNKLKSKTKISTKMKTVKKEKCPCDDTCEIEINQEGTYHMKFHTEQELVRGRLKMLGILNFYKKVFEKV